MRTRDFWRIAQVTDVPQVKFSGIPFRPLSHRERAFSAPPDGLFSLIITPVPHPHMVLSAARESPFRLPTHIFTSYPPVLFMPRKTFSCFRLLFHRNVKGVFLVKYFYKMYTRLTACRTAIRLSPYHMRTPYMRHHSLLKARLPLQLSAGTQSCPSSFFSKTCRDRQHQRLLSTLSHAMSVV